MLDKNDIQILREMFKENNSVLRREILDETRSLIRASEHRIIGEITEFIADAILPQIEDHDVRITRLEKKIA